MGVRTIGSIVAVMVVAASCASASDESVSGRDENVSAPTSTVDTPADVDQQSSSGPESFDGISLGARRQIRSRPSH